MEHPSYCCLDEYEKLISRMSTPRVVIDNVTCATATIVKVDSARKRGLLLEAVQVLADLDLSIHKAYISSDGRWFMAAFHITDLQGSKITDHSLVSYIEQSLGTPKCPSRPNGLTMLELTGTDRPGLLSEVSAVLSDVRCCVIEARAWTHGGLFASLISVKDEAVDDPSKLRLLEGRLRSILNGDGGVHNATVAISSTTAVHSDRRLHQMMLAGRDCKRTVAAAPGIGQSPSVSVQNWVDRGYSVVTVQCHDRAKLLFDVVCTLTDMDYVISHGIVDSAGDRARQEFYVRHVNGNPISSDMERCRVAECLQAAIQRRESQGVRLELCTEDRCGLLADLTCTFRENGLLVAKADISTNGRMASNVFYVTDTAGNPADFVTIDAVRERIGRECLRVRELPALLNPLACRRSSDDWEASGGGGVVALLSLGSLVMRNLYNLGLIKSY